MIAWLVYFFSYHVLSFAGEAPSQLNNIVFVEEYVKEQDSTPIAAAPVPVEPIFKSYSQLGISALTGFHRIDSVDTNTGGKALYLSGPSLGFLGGWEQVWFENWSTGVNLAVEKVKMLKPQVGTLTGGNHKIAQMELYSSWRFDDFGALKFQVGQTTRLISRAISVGNATLDPIDQTYAGMGLTCNLLKKNKLKLDFVTGYNFYLTSDSYRYNIESSRELLIGPRITHDLDNNILDLEISYSIMSQNLGIARQKSKALTTRFGFIFKLGK